MTAAVPRPGPAPATIAPGRRRVLMVAYHFPPLAGSSGIQRTLRFVQYLREHDWEPIVLTAHPRAYEHTSPDLDREVPQGVIVHRAQALDARRHLALFGRYPAALARPDRWGSWRWDGVRAGMELVRLHRPALLWSTYPIATAHLIGAELQRRSGLPWIADFRDPMIEPDEPFFGDHEDLYVAIEQRAVQQAARCVFTTPGAARLYTGRFPQHARRMTVIENGYDEDSFAGLAASDATHRASGPRVLLHSGVVYPAARDPRHLFAALRQLHDAGEIGPGTLRVRFRAAVHDELLRALAAQARVADYIEFAPHVPYARALQEMTEVDGLLILQDANCNRQVPAKLYEYLRAGRPVLALTDPAGDTAAVLRAAGIESIAPLARADAIADLLRAHLQGRLRACAGPDAVQAASRRARTAQLAALMDRVCSEAAGAAAGACNGQGRPRSDDLAEPAGGAMRQRARREPAQP